MTDYSKMTDEQLDDIIARNSGGFDRPSVDSGFFQDIGGYLKKHGEVPGGIGGAMGGAALGTAVMPGVGTLIGGALGGALGSAGGSLASDAMAGEDLDFGDAAKEAAISVAIDAGTFGAGKVLRPIARALNITDGGLTGLFRAKGDPNMADEIVDMSKINANTIESKRVTHQFLTERAKNGGLSAAQTGQASVLRKMGEGLADIGIFSGVLASRRITANNEVIHSAIKDLSEGSLDVAADFTTKGVGQVLHGAVEAGRSAARSLMDDGVNSLVKEHGQRTVSTLPVVKALRKFQMKNTGDIANTVGDSTLKKSTDMMERLLERAGALATAKQADLKSLIDFEKSLQRDISRAMPNSAFSDPVAVAELTQLKKAVQEGITETLGNISPNAGTAYRTLNKEYSETMTDLLPKKLGRAFAGADVGEYDALGRMLLSGGSTSGIEMMMKSLDTAYAVAKKAGTDMTGTAAKNADDARRFIRQGYVKNLFSTVGEATDLTKFANKATQLSTPDAMARAKAVLGKDFNDYKRIVNAISDTSEKTGSSFFQLAMRQKELGTLGSVGAVGVGIGAGMGIASAGMVLLAPMVLSRIVTNKQAVNHLLGLNTAVKRGLINDDTIANGVARVLESLDDDDKEAIRRVGGGYE
jgi:hypothetical protein